VVSPHGLSADERTFWRSLCSNDPTLASPFYSLLFAEAAEKAGLDVAVCVIERDDRLVGFFPSQFRSGITRWLGAAEPVAAGMNDSVGLVALAGLRLSEADLLELSGLSSFSFYNFDERQERYGLSGEKPEMGLFAKLEHGGTAYWQELCARDKVLAKDTRRRLRSLIEKLGPLRFAFREETPHDAIEHLIAAKREQYRRTGAIDALAEEWSQTLLHVLAEYQEPDFSGVMSTLYAGDTWLASHFGIRSRDVLHHCFPVYNPEMSRYAPGRLLNKCLIEAADDQRFSIIDFGAGDSTAKRDFANASRTYLRGRWRRPGAKSLSYALAMSVKWRIDGFRRRV